MNFPKTQNSPISLKVCPSKIEDTLGMKVQAFADKDDFFEHLRLFRFGHSKAV
jgi:hypothetical protein